MADVEKTDFSIKLKGEMDGVDAGTFVDMLGNFSVAIHQINENINPNRSLKIKIHAIEPGCYDIFLSMKEFFFDMLTKHITKENISTAANIVAIFGGMLSIRQFLKGEKPKKVEGKKQQTIIFNGDGNRIVVDNRAYKMYLEDQATDTAIAHGFETLDADDSIKGIELYNKNREKIFGAKRSEFVSLSKSSPAPEKDLKIKEKEATLTIFKVVFEGGYKWQFYYQGNKINATIIDSDFWDRINRGQTFSKGDTLIANLEITQVFDKTIQTYVNKSYTVKSIKQHIKRAEQTKMFE